MSYLRFVDKEEHENPDGRVLPSVVAAIHWAKEFDPLAFDGSPEILVNNFGDESITTWASDHGIIGRIELIEIYPGNYRMARVISDAGYWYACGPAATMKQVAEKMGYPVENVRD